MIETVLGAIRREELGFTLPHEHFFCNTGASNLVLPPGRRDRELARRPVTAEIQGWLAYHWHLNADNLILADEEEAISEAERYAEAGGRSVIDVTSIGIARNPEGLARISKRTGLHIVMGCGYYVAATHPPELAEMPGSAITEKIVREFTEGVDGTGIRPGVIGEVGCSWPLTPVEEKSLRASGEAQCRLGAALYIHPGKHPDALDEIVDTLERSGADLRRVILCHIERTLQDLPRLKGVLRRGCTGEYDLFGMEATASYYRDLGITIPSDAQRLDQIRELIDSGFLGQILISQDICFKHRLHRYGGTGYDHIPASVVPWMRRRGFSEDEIDAITKENPGRLVDR